MKVLFLSSSPDRAYQIVNGCAPELDQQGIEWSIATDPEKIVPDLDLVYLLSYNQILSAADRARVCGRVVLFHSSDLPFGRGWAPIYYAMTNQVRQHTISLCYAADKVDSGNILAKARVPICGNYVASMLRQAGQIAISTMIKRYTARFSGEKPKGLPQPPGESYNPRRTPDDARINVCAIFNDAIPHLLGSEPPNLAYFDHRGHRFRVHVVPDDMELCRDFTIEEYFSGSESPDAVVKLSLTE